MAEFVVKRVIFGCPGCAGAVAKIEKKATGCVEAVELSEEQTDLLMLKVAKRRTACGPGRFDLMREVLESEGELEQHIYQSIF